MTAVLSPFSRVQYAYAVCTTDPGSPEWFSHLHAARHHAIALARACVGVHGGEFPPLTADIRCCATPSRVPCLRFTKGSAVRSMAMLPKETPSVPGILAEDRNRGLQVLRERRRKRPVDRALVVKRGL